VCVPCIPSIYKYTVRLCVRSNIGISLFCYRIKPSPFLICTLYSNATCRHYPNNLNYNTLFLQRQNQYIGMLTTLNIKLNFNERKMFSYGCFYSVYLVEQFCHTDTDMKFISYSKLNLLVTHSWRVYQPRWYNTKATVNDFYLRLEIDSWWNNFKLIRCRTHMHSGNWGLYQTTVSGRVLGGW